MIATYNKLSNFALDCRIYFLQDFVVTLKFISFFLCATSLALLMIIKLF